MYAQSTRVRLSGDGGKENSAYMQLLVFNMDQTSILWH